MEKSVHSSAYSRLTKLLRTTREAANLSQRELAVRLDVAPSWVAKVELGERRIDVVEFARFVSGCDADPMETFALLFGPKAGKASSKRSARHQG
jgi:transcriptional regulator with XRE-family HTH domain